MQNNYLISRLCTSLVFLLFCITTYPCYARTIEFLAAGDVTLAARIIEDPKPLQLFSDAARERIAAADVFLWNCETSGSSTVSKANPYLFHATGALFSEFSA